MASVNGGSEQTFAAPDLPTEGIEPGLKSRVLSRLRGEQTLRSLRKQGLTAPEPIRMAAGVRIDAAFAWAIEIGQHSVIANDVQIIAHDAAIKRLTGYTEVRAVKIGQRCYIGAGAIILPGSVIGDEAVIGAGAVVRGEISARSVAVGSPATVITTTDELTAKHRARMASNVFDARPQEMPRADRASALRAMAEHGGTYVL